MPTFSMVSLTTKLHKLRLDMVIARLTLIYFFLGLALALALPPVSQLWAAVLGLSALLAFELKLHNRGVFWRGLGFGFGYFVFAFHWIGFAFFVDAASDLWMMPFAVGGLALFMASYWGVGFLVARQLTRLHVPLWAALPIVLSVVEWARGYLFTGFPWAVPGLALDASDALLQLASLVGMPGLTLLVLFWGMLPGTFVLYHRRHGAWAVLLFLLFLPLPACWVWGTARLAQSDGAVAQGPLFRLVQPNIAQSDKWRGDNARVIFEDLLALSFEDRGPRPDVIIWPESAVPFLLDESEEGLRRIGEGLQPGQTLLAGSLRRTPPPPGCDTCGEAYFTSILAINDAGQVFDRYDKWRLVPGGEYLPLSWLLEPLGFRKVVSLPESFQPGAGPAAINIPGVGLAASLICYEAIFPHRLLPDGERPRLIVNVTNDGWFGRSVGPYQHLAQVRMRAVENGLPVLRAANTGISTFIDAHGRLIGPTTLELRSVVDSRAPERILPTLYSAWGDTLFFLLLLAVFSISSLFACILGKQSLSK